MVNNTIETYLDSNEVQLKETRIQFQLRSSDQKELRSIKLGDKNELKNELNSIENTKANLNETIELSELS